MAKCTICNSRKGKRKCQATSTFICSRCCGESRSEEQCGGCSFFGGAVRRNYRKLPYYTINEMEASGENELISRSIESTLTMIWNSDRSLVNDRTALRLLEMLLDHYHFGEEPGEVKDQVLAVGYQALLDNIAEEFDQLEPEKLVKVLGAVYRSIQRHSSGGTTYLQFISRFTGGMYMADEQD